MKYKQISISLGFEGSLNYKIKNSWKILKKEFNIEYISKNSCKPHINLHAGSIKKTNIREIAIRLKKFKLRKFKIKSPGSAIFFSDKPNLFIRWETNLFIKKYREIIRNDLKKFFIKENIYTNNNLWIPRSAIAYKDISYSKLENISKRLKFLFQKHTVEVNYILLIDYSKGKEIIINKIKLI